MNIAAIAAGIRGKSALDLIKKAGAQANQIKQDTSQPGHTHSADSSKSQARTAAEQARTAAEQAGDITAPTGGGFGGILSRPDPSFMGKNQTISDMEFSDMTRGGKAKDPMIENNPVQTAGNFSPLGTPDFVPREDSEEYGQQFIS
tara:strand:+ start:60 stop:497 length:438 start_codon:yes stop_codon:yes gene_type:complete